jgi:hypothetical protein
VEVLAFNVTAIDTAGRCKWRVHKALKTPRRPFADSAASPLPSSVMQSQQTPSDIGEMDFEESSGCTRDWNAVAEQLAKDAAKAIRAWPSQSLYIEVEFPGWLHIARVDTRSLSEWVALTHAAFGPLIERGALPARVNNSRDGVVTASTTPWISLVSRPGYGRTIPYKFWATPMRGSHTLHAKWAVHVNHWAARVFDQLSGHVQLPRPHQYVAMRAALRFDLPYPIPK